MKNKIIQFIRGSFLLSKDSSKNWSLILFFSFLSLLMINSSHSIDKKIHEIARINEMGISSSTEPPIKIIVNK